MTKFVGGGLGPTLPTFSLSDKTHGKYMNFYSMDDSAFYSSCFVFHSVYVMIRLTDAHA